MGEVGERVKISPKYLEEKKTFLYLWKVKQQDNGTEIDA
jgi:hypothetical protein